MKLLLDPERCVGHGRCYELAPDLLGEDERGHCRILVSEVPAGLERLALRALANCPERALSSETPSGTSALGTTAPRSGGAPSRT